MPKYARVICALVVGGALTDLSVKILINYELQVIANFAQTNALNKCYTRQVCIFRRYTQKSHEGKKLR